MNQLSYYVTKRLIVGSKDSSGTIIQKEKKLGWNMVGKKILNPAELTSFHQTFISFQFAAPTNWMKLNAVWLKFRFHYSFLVHSQFQFRLLSISWLICFHSVLAPNRNWIKQSTNETGMEFHQHFIIITVIWRNHSLLLH